MASYLAQSYKSGAATMAAFKCVYISAADTVTQLDTCLGVVPMGVTLEDCKYVSTGIGVCTSGECRAIANYAISIGSLVVATYDGRVTVLPGLTAASCFSVGRLIGAAGGSTTIGTGTVVRIAVNVQYHSKIA